MAAHCVQLGPGDAERLAEAGAGAAHCPRSNAYLRCGRAPLERLRAAGVPVGLGTDSPGSGGGYDVRSEARGAAIVHGAAGARGPRRDRPPAAGHARRRPRAGARGPVGALRPGLRADLVAVEPAPGAEPGDPAAAVLDPAARIRLVMVDGRVVLDERGPVLVDRAEVLDRASGARSRLC